MVYVADTPSNVVSRYANTAYKVTHSGQLERCGDVEGGVPASTENVEVRHVVTLTDNREAQMLKIGPAAGERRG